MVGTFSCILYIRLFQVIFLYPPLDSPYPKFITFLFINFCDHDVLEKIDRNVIVSRWCQRDKFFSLNFIWFTLIWRLFCRKIYFPRCIFIEKIGKCSTILVIPMYTFKFRKNGTSSRVLTPEPIFIGWTCKQHTILGLDSNHEDETSPSSKNDSEGQFMRTKSTWMRRKVSTAEFSLDSGGYHCLDLMT